MTVFVFTGPTLSPHDAQAELTAIYLPPVSQGDVYRAAQHKPTAIGIIDGYFERVPAVWHKEILWAMSQGIHVYGSASMGALRAAELAQFGMTGVGAIFQAFRDGVLEDDDEVAVAHGAVESGYRAMSDAMVNIRATLARARAEHILGDDAHTTIERTAKRLFYADRVYERVLRQAEDLGVAAGEVAAFRAWLPHGRVDQKRDDALVMLRTIRAEMAASNAPKRVRYRFEHTVWWDHATRIAGTLALESGSDATVSAALLLDELRLAGGDRYFEAHQRTTVRYLAVADALRRNLSPTPDAVRVVANEFLEARGIDTDAALREWQERNHLVAGHLEGLLREEAMAQSARDQIEGEIVQRLPDQLRLRDEYRPLLERAVHKQQALHRLGLENPGLADADLTEAALIAWYLERQGRSLAARDRWHPQDDGFADEDAFLRAALREYLFLRAAETPWTDGIEVQGSRFNSPT